ncbi:MAG: hypothetical protein WCP12_18160 [bacterium]
MKNNMFVLLRLIIGVAAMAVGMTANAYTNALTTVYAEKIDRDIRRGAEWEAVNTIHLLEKTGDLEALSYFAEKSFSTNVVRFIREPAAAAYVKIADLDESVEFMRKIFTINDNKGYWRSTIAPLFLQKVEAAISNHTITDETLKRVFSVLLAYAQSPANSQEADYVDVFLVNHCAGYQTSRQRLSMAKSISDGGNDLEKKHFLPIKESVEALPKKQRIDLRKRFPDLPLLQGEKNAGTCSKTALAIGAAFAAICAAVWLAAKRRKTQTR